MMQQLSPDARELLRTTGNMVRDQGLTIIGVADFLAVLRGNTSDSTAAVQRWTGLVQLSPELLALLIQAADEARDADRLVSVQELSDLLEAG